MCLQQCVLVYQGLKMYIVSQVQLKVQNYSVLMIMSDLLFQHEEAPFWNTVRKQEHME